MFMNEIVKRLRTIGLVAIATTFLTSTSIGISTAAQSPNRTLIESDTIRLDVPLIARDRSHANSTSRNQSRATVSGDTYSFTMTLPSKSRSPFTKLSFSLTNIDRGNAIVPIPFDYPKTTALVGTPNAPKDAIAVKYASIDEAGTLWVEFNSPVPANTTLTVVFKARQPLLAGQYAYSIAAYPQNSSASGVFVGDGTVVE
jgi:hypothetical protein